jgi:hypothetical protein
MGVVNDLPSSSLPDEALESCINWNLQTNGGTLKTRKGYVKESLLALGWYAEREADDTSDWTLSTDGANKALDSEDYITGKSSLEFDKTGTTEAYVYADAAPTNTDLSRYERIKVYVKAPTGCNCDGITLIAFSNANNYFYQTTSISEGEWQLSELVFDTALSVGSPATDSMTSIRVQFNLSATSDTGNDFLIDGIIVERPAKIRWMGKYAKNTGEVFYMAVADGNIWKREDVSVLNGQYLYKSIYSGFAEDEEASAVTFGDKIYFFNAESYPVSWDGEIIASLGIDPPDPPGLKQLVASGSLYGTYRYVVTHYSTTLLRESASSITSPEITADEEDIEIYLPGAPDDELYDKFRIYRNTGGDIFFYVDEVDVTSESYVDDTPNDELSATALLDSADNYAAPSGLTYSSILADRIVSIYKNSADIRYSRRDNAEAWSNYNLLRATTNDEDKLNAISEPSGNTLLLMTQNTIWKLMYTGGTTVTYGTDPSKHPFVLEKVSPTVGCLSHHTLLLSPSGYIWLALDGVYMWSLGSGLTRISEPVDWFDSINYDAAREARASLLGDYYRVSIPTGDSERNVITYEYNWRAGGWTEHTYVMDFGVERNNQFYHSAIQGYVTYESGYDDDGNNYSCEMKLPEKDWGAAGANVLMRKLQISSNASGEDMSVKQYFDLGADPYTYASGNASQTVTLDGKIKRVNLAGKGKEASVLLQINPDSVETQIDRVHLEFVVGTIQ